MRRVSGRAMVGSLGSRERTRHRQNLVQNCLKKRQVRLENLLHCMVVFYRAGSDDRNHS